jgi:nucleotide-binding universal stress UspA family protein
MTQVFNILAAVDQFPHDDMVLARAAEFARAHKSKLTIVHVIDGFSRLQTAPAGLDQELIQQQLRIIAEENIEAALAKLQIEAVAIDIRIELGTPSLRLIELCKEIRADLLVMRAHQSDSIVEKIIGSTTDRVLRAACAPVLVVKRAATQAYQRVVVAIEKPSAATAGIPFVAALLPAAALYLIHSVQIPPQFEAALLRAGTGQASIAAHRDAMVDKAKVNMRALSKTLGKRPQRTTTRVATGDPSTSLARATRNPKVELIAKHRTY